MARASRGRAALGAAGGRRRDAPVKKVGQGCRDPVRDRSHASASRPLNTDREKGLRCTRGSARQTTS